MSTSDIMTLLLLASTVLSYIAAPRGFLGFMSVVLFYVALGIGVYTAVMGFMS